MRLKNGLICLLVFSLLACFGFGCSGPDSRGDNPNPDEQPTAGDPAADNGDDANQLSQGSDDDTEPADDDGAENADDTSQLGNPGGPWYPRQDIGVIHEIEVCDANWLNPDNPSERMDMPCAEAFLRYGYGMQNMSEKEYREALPQELTLDPFGGATIELRYSRQQFARMAELAERCTDVDGDLGVCDRAVEYLNLVTSRKLGLFEDMNMMEITPVLKKVLAGDKLSEADLYPYKEGNEPGPTWSALTYWKLGNAVYARHGVPMEDPDLAEFFYGDLRDEWKTAGLPDLDENPDVAAELTEADEHNLKLLRDASPVQLP